MTSFGGIKKDLLELVNIMRYPIAVCVLCTLVCVINPYAAYPVAIFMPSELQYFESLYSFAYGLMVFVGTVLFYFAASIIATAAIIVLGLRWLFRKNFYDCSFIYPGGAY